MKNKLSLAFSLTLALLIPSCLSLSANPDLIYRGDEIGFPFVVYSSVASGDEGGFSLLGLLGNAFLFFSSSMLVCILIEKLKKLGQNRNLRTYP